jgi:Bcr/CflA subfamily drug resistance transporter
MLSEKKPSFLILFLLISFGSVSAVLFTPSLPQISNYFIINNHIVQLTITLFLVGYTIGQLIYGPLSNRYGRKKALYTGIIIQIIASVLCILSANLHAFWLLATARLLMALGASVGLKMSFTLVADSYSPEQSTKIISHLTIAFAVTPGLAVTLGGFLTEHINWQSCFYFLALYGVYLLYLTYRMPETTATLDYDALKLSKIGYKYWRKIKNLELVISSLLMGCCTAIVYIFSAMAPFIAMNLMQLNPSQYGLWNLLPPIGGIVGSQLSAYFSKKLRSTQAIFLGVGVASFGIIIMISAFALQALFPIWLFLPLLIIYIGISFIFANASTVAMQAVQDKASGSAMMNFLNMGLATFSVLLAGLITIQSSLLLPFIYIFLLGLALLLSICLFLITFIPRGKPRRFLFKTDSV